MLIIPSLAPQIDAIENSVRKVETIVFTPAIKFSNALTVYQDHIVTGPLTLTVDRTNAINGGTAWVTLVANGTNIPTFSGMTKLANSGDYVNTTNAFNFIRFMRINTTVYYTI